MTIDQKDLEAPKDYRFHAEKTDGLLWYWGAHINGYMGYKFSQLITEPYMILKPISN